MLEEKQILKLWEKTHHGENSSYDIFKRWIINYNILSKINILPCQINQLKGMRKKSKYHYSNEFETINKSQLSDSIKDSYSIYSHSSYWKNDFKQKILVLQPYLSHNEEIDNYKLFKIERWCKENKLYYKILKSWYYPNECMLVQISNIKI